MKRVFCMIATVLVSGMLFGCGKSGDNPFTPPTTDEQGQSSGNSKTGGSSQSAGNNPSSDSNQNNEAMKIKLQVGNNSFMATLSESETGRAFYSRLPLSLNMSELNGNEKYNYLSDTLPTSFYRPGTIEAGDLLLYGNNCVVLFYETFQSSYSYTRIGKVDNPFGLRQAVGTGAVTIRFEKE